MQAHRICHTLAARLLLALWLGVPLGTFLHPLWATPAVHCHCPGHAKRALPTGPAFAPCDDTAAMTAAAFSPPPALEAPGETAAPSRVRASLHPDDETLLTQAVLPVESPPPRRTI